MKTRKEAVGLMDMAKPRYGERVGALHVKCPFCGELCDRTSSLTWCSGCYCEWTVTSGGRCKFDPNKKTERFALAKALQRSGGTRIGGNND